MAKTETAAIGVTAWTRSKQCFKDHIRRMEDSPCGNARETSPSEMTLKQLELKCTSNTVHFVLNEEHSKDALLNSNEVRQLLGRTHVLYLLRNGWMPRILQENVTSSAIGSSKFLTDLRAESIFSMQSCKHCKESIY